MSDDDRSNRHPRVIGAHGSSSKGDTSRLGRVALALLLVGRTVVWTVGCSPPDGSKGGKCNDNGCNTYCNEGLQCDNGSNTCVNGGSTPSPAPPTTPRGCNFNGTDATCAQGQLAYQCVGGTPASENGVPGCAYASNDRAGNAIYCCTPTCTLRSSLCGDPSATYVCTGSALPADVGGPVACATLSSHSGSTEYCCAAADTCFAAPELFLPGCPYADATFCTGAATPSSAGRTCNEAPKTDAGAGTRTYCCSENVGDGGDSG